MKRTGYYFKAFGLLMLTAMSAGCLTAQGADKAKGDKDGDIKAFFSDYLSGKAATYDSDARLKLSDVEKEQARVWKAWREANDNYDEQKLIAFDTLSASRSGRWELPADLEPDAVMPYYWGFKGEKPDDGYPMYLYMHGSGDKNNEWKNGIRFATELFEDAPSVYFIPQIPNTGNYYRWYQKSKQFAWEKLLRLALASGQIDPNKIYFFGISEGGYGSQRLASFYADYLAGAGPMAGGEPLKNAPVENCRNMAFSLRTGDKDFGFYRDKLTKYTKSAFDSLENLNPGSFIHWIELIPGMGHHIDYKPTTPWLRKFDRNPYPKFVSWENFEMDGLYRDGFYNIYVKERSNDDDKTRTYYEMSIDGNNIDLEVDEVSYKATETDPRWGIELSFERSYEPATKGKVVIYLNDELVDLSKPVTLTVNGKTAFSGKVELEVDNIVNSCAAFFDPERLYPAAIEIDIARLK